MRTLKANDTVKAQSRTVAFLDAAEVHKWVVLRGVQLDEALRLARNGSRNVAAVGEEAVAEIHSIGPGRRQTFLVGLPAHSCGNELVGNGLAGSIWRRGNGKDAIDVVFSRVAPGSA